jgi:hypothetical protein
VEHFDGNIGERDRYSEVGKRVAAPEPRRLASGDPGREETCAMRTERRLLAVGHLSDH